MFTLHYVDYHCLQCFAFSASTLLVGWQEGYPACKKTEWWGAGMVISLERVADLHMTQLMLLPLTVSSFSKIQIGFTFLVLAHLGSPGKRAVKRVCVCRDTCLCVCKVLWTGRPCQNFHLLLCIAVLVSEKTVLIQNNFGFTEILKVVRLSVVMLYHELLV